MRSEKIMPGWSYAGVALTFVLLLTMVLYQQAVLSLTNIWNQLSEGEYAHGYLVLAISVYLIIRNRKQLAIIAPCPCYSVLPLILLSSLLWLVAVFVDVKMLQSVSLLCIVFATVWAVVGHQVMAQLAFPILFISFAIPVWFPLSPLLQDLTADVVFWIVRIIEVPAFKQENLIIVPAGILSIEETCSGLRYLLAALTLGSLYAYLNYVTLSARLAVVCIAAATAVLANILRVFVVVYLGYATDMQHPWVADHLMLGWYLFGGLVAILLFLDARLYKHQSTATGSMVTGFPESGSPATSANTTEVISDKPCTRSGVHLFTITLMCSILLLTGPVIVHQKSQQHDLLTSKLSISLPVGVEGWVGPTTSTNSWLPRYHGAISAKKDYQRQLDQGPTDEISLFIAYYPWQKQGEEVINELNRISNTKIWQTKYSRARIQQTGNHVVLEQQIESSQNKKQLVWYWYNIGGWVTTNKYEAKVLQLAGMLLDKPQAYVVAVSIAVDDDEDQDRVRQVLQDFISDMNKLLSNLLVTENISL